MSAKDLEAGVTVGDFRIEERVGAGGMGIVYRARQVSLNRVVALKVLGGALTDPRDVARFRRAAQAAAKLRHPAIAQVYFVGQDRDACFMAMEFVEGVTLEQAVRRLATTARPDATLDTVARPSSAGPAGEMVRFDALAETADECGGPG